MLRTVPGSSTDVGGVKVTTRYERDVYCESESSTSGIDSPSTSYSTTDLLSLRVRVCVCVVHTYNFYIYSTLTGFPRLGRFIGDVKFLNLLISEVRISCNYSLQ